MKPYFEKIVRYKVKKIKKTVIQSVLVVSEYGKIATKI